MSLIIINKLERDFQIGKHREYDIENLLAFTKCNLSNSYTIHVFINMSCLINMI